MITLPGGKMKTKSSFKNKLKVLGITGALLFSSLNMKDIKAAESYKLHNDVNTYYSADDARNKTNAVKKYSKGNYYIYKTYNGMVNISTVEDQAGAWINPKDNLELAKGKTMYVANNVNMRSKASVKSAKVNYLLKGEEVLAEDMGNWFKVAFDGSLGYVSKNFLSEKYVSDLNYSTMYIENNVNVRKGPATDFARTGYLERGSKVEAVRTGNWYRVSNGQAEGFVHKNFITNKPVIDSSTELTNKIVSKALEYKGYPYVWGSKNPSVGFDCSGLIHYVYKTTTGDGLGASTHQQILRGRTVSSNNMKPGDLMFFGSVSNPFHVAMYIGNNKMIHAATPSQGVIIQDANNSWAASNLATVKRIVE